MIRCINKTMVQGRNYGPQVIVRRISTGSKCGADPPIFIQVAKQVNNMKPLDLRLPSRAWKVIINYAFLFLGKRIVFNYHL